MPFPGRLGKLVMIAAVCYGGWYGYQKWQRDVSTLDRARFLVSAGDATGAIPLLEQAAAEDPYDLSIQLDLADCYASTGEPLRAIQAYRAAEPLMNRESESVSMRRHKERYVFLRQRFPG